MSIYSEATLVESAESAQIYRLGEDVLIGRVNENRHVDIKEAKRLEEILFRLCDSKPFYIIVDARVQKLRVDFEARSYLSSEAKYIPYRKGFAGITQSASIRFLGNIYFKMHNYKSPFKLFNSEKKVLNWIEELKRKDLGK